MANYALFNLNDNATTAPIEAKVTIKDVREELSKEFKGPTAPTWAGYNSAFSARNWAVTPSKSLCVDYFGKDLGGKVWADIEARWLLLQAMAAVYVDEMHDVTKGMAERVKTNKARKADLFKHIRGLLAYHGINLGRDLKPADLITLGELAIKFTFVLDSGEAEAKALGVTAYIKAALYALMSTDSKKGVLSKLCERAMSAVRKARKNADTVNWDEGNKPKCLLG